MSLGFVALGHTRTPMTPFDLSQERSTASVSAGRSRPWKYDGEHDELADAIHGEVITAARQSLRRDDPGWPKMPMQPNAMIKRQYRVIGAIENAPQHSSAITVGDFVPRQLSAS